jgi:O-methyltransferase involved in polyketide biosynthesis
MLATLYGRALDAQSERPILHDTMAADAVRQLGLDFAATGLRPGDAEAVALRGAHFDARARDFLAAHPSATVLHLGCGLDTRVYRLGPGPGVRWYDVDFPDVIELRRRLYPPRGELVGASVTDPAWLAPVPADRPVLVLAEGLTMYLREADGRALLRRFVEHFGHGQFAFDALSPLGIRMQVLNGAVRAAGATLYWGIKGPADLESIDPRLRCVEALSAFDLEGYADLGRRFRVAAAVARYVPGLKRMATFYRLEF